MTTKRAVETKGTDENGLRWEDAEIAGTVYRVREVTVEESDTAFDASQNPDGTFNPRLNQRMLLSTSIVSPDTGLDTIARWGVAKLVALLAVYDRVNSLPPADTQGNG